MKVGHGSFLLNQNLGLQSDEDSLVRYLEILCNVRLSFHRKVVLPGNIEESQKDSTYVKNPKSPQGLAT